jgi:hypothetical protein
MIRFCLAMVLMLTAFPFGKAAERKRSSRLLSAAPFRFVVHDDFLLGARGWSHGFADYAVVHEASMELDGGLRPLPPEIGSGTGYFLTAHNRSDDVFMFLTKKFSTADGIRANQRYRLHFKIRIASNAGGEECAGIGGHPGFSVYLKAGAAAIEPRSILETGGSNDAHFRMNVDKGNQSQGGDAATVAGHISTGSRDCSFDAPFQTIEREHEHSFDVRASDAAELWFLIGTDSGFEGKTRLYYQSVTATLEPRP